MEAEDERQRERAGWEQLFCFNHQKSMKRLQITRSKKEHSRGLHYNLYHNKCEVSDELCFTSHHCEYLALLKKASHHFLSCWND